MIAADLLCRRAARPKSSVLGCCCWLWWWCQRPNSDVPRPLQHAEAIAAELLCLAASSDAGRALLAPVVESGTLYSLLNSRFVTCRHVTSSCIT